MAAWHWNENGTWIDSEYRSGYFTGNTDLKQSIRYILGYAKPSRTHSPRAMGQPALPVSAFR